MKLLLTRKNSTQLEDIPLKMLSPVDNVDNGIYNNALQTAMKEPGVFNIAVSGPYGSGKSSIIKTFEKAYTTKHKRFLYVSLASFNSFQNDSEKDSINDCTTKNQNETLKEQLIELGILQQIFYHVKPSKIPDSRFNRIQSIGSWRLALIVSMFAMWFLSVLISFQVKFNSDSAFSELVKLGDKPIVLWSSFVISLIGACYLVGKSIRFSNGIKFDKMNLKSGEIELSCPKEESILNKYIDEIIYYFEVNKKYCAVVIEDLDRFRDHQIFTKLREINVLINRSKVIRDQGRKVVFVYALCDNLFRNKDRTKFFDIIIPVIPIINTSNSSDVLNTRLKEIECLDEIQKELIYDIQLYVDDMRLLLNITNEYIIYKDKIGKAKDLNMTKLFAMVVFKNFYPDEFVLLHIGHGIVYDILSVGKEKFIDHCSVQINDRRELLKKEINSVESAFVNNEHHLRVFYVGYIWSQLTNPLKLEGNYTFEMLLNKDSWAHFIKKRSFTYTDHRGSTSSSNKTFKEYEFEIDPNFTLEKRIELLQDDKEKSLARLRVELEQMQRKLKNLRNKSIKGLANEFEIDLVFPVLAEKRYQLLRYLIRLGYIDEDYAFYLSYFYPGSLSETDKAFVLAVKNGKEKEIDYPIVQIENVVNRIYGDQFSSTAALNYSLLLFLLDNRQKYENELDLYIRQIGGINDRTIELIRKCLNLEKYQESFFHLFYKKCKRVWYLIDRDARYTNEEKDRLLLMLFQFSDIKSILEQDEEDSVRDRLINRENILSFVPVNASSNFEIFIKERGLVIPALNAPVYNKKFLNFLDENLSYTINPHNVWTIFQTIEGKGQDIELKFKTQNATAIDESKCKHLKRLVSEFTNHYIQFVYLQIEENVNDKEEYVLGFLVSEAVSKENKIGIVKKWGGKIRHINAINDSAIEEILLTNCKVEATWSNVLLYWRQKQNIDTALAIFLNSKANCNSLIESLDTVDSDEEYYSMVEQLFICNELADDIYDLYCSKIEVAIEDFDFSSINKSKVDSLIRYGLLFPSIQNFSKLNEVDDVLLFDFVVSKKKDFINKADQISISDMLLGRILESNDFVNSEKLSVVNKIGRDKFTSDVKIANAVLNLVYYDLHGLSIDFIQQIYKSSNDIGVQIMLLIELLEERVIGYDVLDELLDATKAPYDQLIKISYSKLILKNDRLNIELVQLLKDNEFISSYNVKNDKIIVHRRRVK